MVPSFGRLQIATNTPSFAYKPLHEYRIHRVSNSPHLCELCTTLLFLMQHIPLFTISFLPSAATSGGILDRAVEAEDKKHGDFLRLVR
ncbi:hypothetical protein BHM03_00039431 [Ensete ventricosum]|nr:hypothetical protein BHM03_00039431 [Ensete ventricosum]